MTLSKPKTLFQLGGLGFRALGRGLGFWVLGFRGFCRDRDGLRIRV